ncbi:ubiquinone biosynthesis protein [Chitinimonas sp. PSY-7]|uniref:ubiquinone biosynthesis protein n=1 Tax=Chitinimonas sp. PSY-7 TaxID=3459088 RepID=UPI004040148A
MFEMLLATLVSYPTNLVTVLLAVLLIYWLLALAGLVDIDAFDLDVHVDSDAGELSTIAGYVVAFGLTGVPFSIVLSLIVLIVWVICYLANRYLLFWMPGWMSFMVGSAVLVAAAAVAIVVTARLLRPMRGLFAVHNARQNASLIGQTCKITTLDVSEDFGQALVETEGVAIAIRVRASKPNGLGKGSLATIVDYDEASETYQVIETPLI